MASRAVIIGPSRYAVGSGLEPHQEIRQSAQCYGEMLGQDQRWAGRVEVVPEEGLGTINDVMDVVQRAAERVEKGDTFMVVYVGHGAYWGDVPGGQVHFAVDSSRKQLPYTWLSSWYIYRAMQRSKAKLKVLIADCCYSNFLPALGDEDGGLRGVLNERNYGTCVLTAVKEYSLAQAEGCRSRNLPEELQRCTPFSGHLLNVLRKGSADHKEFLSLGVIRDTVHAEMANCDYHHPDLPRMILNDAGDKAALFTNRMERSRREPEPVDHPVTVPDWADGIVVESFDESNLEVLFANPVMAGQVVKYLFRRPDQLGRDKAQDVHERASERYREQDDRWASYWAQVG